MTAEQDRDTDGLPRSEQQRLAAIHEMSKNHLRRYLESNGEDGYLEWGKENLVLTTIGHKSGKVRMTPLIFGRDSERFVLVASNGGSTDHPAWYRNLVANSHATIQVRDKRYKVRAYTAAGDERRRLWRDMTSILPVYDDYAQRCEREIPVVVLEPDAAS